MPYGTEPLTRYGCIIGENSQSLLAQRFILLFSSASCTAP